MAVRSEGVLDAGVAADGCAVSRGEVGGEGEVEDGAVGGGVGNACGCGEAVAGGEADVAGEVALQVGEVCGGVAGVVQQFVAEGERGMAFEGVAGAGGGVSGGFGADAEDGLQGLPVFGVDGQPGCAAFALADGRGVQEGVVRAEVWHEGEAVGGGEGVADVGDGAAGKLCPVGFGAAGVVADGGGAVHVGVEDAQLRQSGELPAVP